jgi:hypothetical protein
VTDHKYLIVFAKYLMGELHADFVDQDGLDDIATSDRQSLNETDQRYEALRKTLEDVLRTVGNSWRDWRRDDALDKARKNPVVEESYSSLRVTPRSSPSSSSGRSGTSRSPRSLNGSSSGTATRSCPWTSPRSSRRASGDFTQSSNVDD